MNIIAHRGASAYKTENTMAAFETAVEMQVDGIELDVRLTKDGIPIIHHDPTINRLSNGKGYIHQLTLQALQTFTFKKKTFPLQKRMKIVTLETFFTYMKKHPSITLHLELKNDPELENDLVEKVLQVSADYEMEERIVYSSFDHDLLQHVSQFEPTAKIGLLCHKNITDIFDYIDNLRMPIHSLHPKYHLVTADIVKQAHQRNIQVNPYTVNKKRMALKLKKLGIDGLITNNPKILQQTKTKGY